MLLAACEATQLRKQMIENGGCGRLRMLSHGFEDAQIAKLLIRILGHAPRFGDSIAEDHQGVTRYHGHRLFLVRRIRKESEREASHCEVSNGLVVHEYRTALSGIAVAEAALRRHDADERRHKPARNGAPAERAIQMRHGTGRAIVPFGLDGEDALHDGSLESCWCPITANVTQCQAKLVGRVLVVE